MQSGKRGQTHRGNQGMTHGKISGEIHAGLRGRSSRRQMEEGRGSDQMEGFSLEIDGCVTRTTHVVIFGRGKELCDFFSSVTYKQT